MLTRGEIINLGERKIQRGDSESGCDPEAEELPEDAASAKANSTVCLVDDDPSVLKATSRLLSSAGWKVESFADPNAFLRYSENHRPPVAVLDVAMPAMNGLEVQERLRSICPSTRVIVLTSKDDSVVRSKALAAGASAFFLKPVDDDEFLAGIASALAGN